MPSTRHAPGREERPSSYMPMLLAIVDFWISLVPS